MSNEIQIHVELTEQEAQAYAQLLKRVGLADYKVNAQNEAEAYLMQQTGEKVRKALADAGFSPR